VGSFARLLVLRPPGVSSKPSKLLKKLICNEVRKNTSPMHQRGASHLPSPTHFDVARFALSQTDALVLVLRSFGVYGPKVQRLPSPAQRGGGKVQLVVRAEGPLVC
jgi:hypothetical protein